MIEVRDVSFRYPEGAQSALGGVSMQIGPGEVVGIVGPNGSGKSTLGRLIKGLILPTTGDILVNGLDSALDGLEIRRLVGLIFQNPNSQIVNAVVEQEVAFGPENLGVPAAEIRSRVAAALSAVGLSGHEEDECHSLSMADKQRIAIASVIAMEPRYLVLDEPTAWIEPPARWRLLDEVRRWALAREVGLVLITHRMDEAQLCDRVYGVLHGRVEATGKPEEILADPDIRHRLALAIPEAYALTVDLRRAGLPVTPGEPLERVVETLWPS